MSVTGIYSCWLLSNPLRLTIAFSTYPCQGLIIWARYEWREEVKSFVTSRLCWFIKHLLSAALQLSIPQEQG